MSTTALGSALSGLRVAQKALDVTAVNISNANTDGYTKKSLSQENIAVGGVGIGVRYGEVSRYVDEAVQRDYRTQLGVQSFLSTTTTYLSRITAFHGSTEQESNIAARLAGVHDKFVALSATPNSTTAQNDVLAQAGKLVSSLNNYSAHLLTTRNDVEREIQAEVKTLNTTLENIAELNRKIRTMTALGRSTADMEDHRDMLAKQIAQQLDISYFKDGENSLVIQTKNGGVLADTQARPITFDAKNVSHTSTYPASLGGLIVGSGVDAIDLAAGTPGGKLGALFNLRDQEIPKYNAELDELAHKLMMRFDDQNLRLFTDENGVVPVNDPAIYTGIAGKIRINPVILANSSLLQQGTSGPAVGEGSSDVIMKIINFTFGKTRDASGTPNVAFNTSMLGAERSIKFDIIGDPNTALLDFSTAMLDGQATDYNTVKSNLDAEQLYTQNIEKRMLDTSSVNTDEEMANMIVLQRNYAASAKMISALDQLFRDLLNAI